ncbi:MAG: hypothetical protein ACLFV7_08810 [Phycisphaerae bacterium]
MNVFLAGIIQGSKVAAEIHAQDWREPIKAALEQHVPHAEVYCHYTCHPNSITYELPQIRETLEDGIARAARSDLVIAYCPSASMGTAIEIYEACRNRAVVLAVTPLIANWVLRVYTDRIFSDVEALASFLQSEEFDQLYRDKRGREATA